MTTKDVADTISRGEAGVMMHGPTFMGNPLACAIAIASFDLLAEQDMARVIGHISDLMSECLAPAAEYDSVADVRVIGAIGVIEMKHPVDLSDFQKQCVARGIWVRPFGRNVYIMPPYIIGDSDLRRLCAEMLAIIR